MPDVNKFTDIVKNYVGTPFKQHARTPGAGLDCVGVLACAVHEMGWTHYKDVKGYSIRPADSLLSKTLISYGVLIVPKSEIKPGDILEFFYESTPQHVGVAVEENGVLCVVHAYMQRKKVIIHRIDEGLKVNISRVYRLPELVNG